MTALRSVADDERGTDIDRDGPLHTTEYELRVPDRDPVELKCTRDRALQLRDAEPGAKLYSRHANRSTVTTWGAWAEVIG